MTGQWGWSVAGHASASCTKGNECHSVKDKPDYTVIILERPQKECCFWRWRWDRRFMYGAEAMVSEARRVLSIYWHRNILS